MYGLNQIIVALVFHFIDLLSGIVGAVRNNDLKSSKMRDGMFKKVGFIFCYVLAVLLDTQGEAIGIQIGVKILPVIIVYAVTTEIVSIIENICRINPDLVPEKLQSMFHVSKEGEENA